ncbi:MAG: PilZ domain-containing protein [Candidatus Acidiferrum sp.]
MQINRTPATATRPAITRPPTSEERRRAQRVLLRMPVLLHLPNRTEPVEAQTHTVSQNGAMILSPEALAEGTVIALENPRNQKRVDARVVRPPQVAQGGSLVPVEFTTPSPTFWAVFFPPAFN